MPKFQLYSPWQPKGEQPRAIDELVAGFQNKKKKQTLLGVTGSGKTFVMANVIQKLQVPTLIISHNKTLAAQLYSEFKSFFPNNAVEYFISYYDYYQPEAYIASRDMYIEKEATINEQIDRLRMAATSSLLTRQDVIVVASVSCIYNVGDPKNYKEMVVYVENGKEYNREMLLHDLVNIQYNREDSSLERGKFRVRGDTIEIYPSYVNLMLKIELFGNTIEKISWCDSITCQNLQDVDKAMVYPAKHYVLPKAQIETGIQTIFQEMEEWGKKLRSEGKEIEANRITTRTLHDMEMLKETGYCGGMENYSRHFSQRKKGERPCCLLDYFSKPFLTIVDESHVTVPQISGMYLGDRSRKQSLIDYGFRLPSALDNRPNTLEEWAGIVDDVLFVSATPGEYEEKQSGQKPVELLTRPTGLVDPIVEVRGTDNQIEDVCRMVQERVAKNERVLITTLTKSLAENLTEYLQSRQIQVNYLHCDVETFDRVSILQDLRRGKISTIVGINLLREGLDLPEVSLVTILDADKQGFLRSKSALIQTMGRCARNVNATVILYADTITPAMKEAIAETSRRRTIQLEYNAKYNITPQTIQKEILSSIEYILQEEKNIEKIEKKSPTNKAKEEKLKYSSEKSDDFIIPTILQSKSLDQRIQAMENEMKKAALDLNFEYATILRDQIFKLKGISIPEPPRIGNKRKSRRAK